MLVVLLSARDRLLLAFANLASYGITARSAVDGDADAAHREIRAELRAEYPLGRGSYVFWLKSDESGFSPSGQLVERAGLVLHYGNEEDVEGIKAACKDLELDIASDHARGALRVRDARAAR